MQTQYRKKPAVFTAITFDQLIAHGIAQSKEEGRESNIIDGRPWSFNYKGYPITHERDDCYIIPTRIGGSFMGPDDMLVIDEKGAIEVCKRVEFEATHEPAGIELHAVLESHEGFGSIEGDLGGANVESRLRVLEIANTLMPSSIKDLMMDAEDLLQWIRQDTKSISALD